jgi:hypothetical protein
LLIVKMPHDASASRPSSAFWVIEALVGTRDMFEDEKEHVVTRVVEICAEIKVFQSNAMTGSDCNWMSPLQEPRDDRVEVLQQQCQELGMDCSVFILSHNGLGPTNMIVNGDRIVVIDWEMAGYAPRNGCEPSSRGRGNQPPVDSQPNNACLHYPRTLLPCVFVCLMHSTHWEVNRTRATPCRPTGRLASGGVAWVRDARVSDGEAWLCTAESSPPKNEHLKGALPSPSSLIKACSQHPSSSYAIQLSLCPNAFPKFIRKLDRHVVNARCWERPRCSQGEASEHLEGGIIRTPNSDHSLASGLVREAIAEEQSSMSRKLNKLHIGLRHSTDRLTEDPPELIPQVVSRVIKHPPTRS